MNEPTNKASAVMAGEGQMVNRTRAVHAVRIATVDLFVTN